jgi:SAM-dependent methyltransferase
MNFKIAEITSWYKTVSGNINAQLIIDTINRSFHAARDQNIVYIGPYCLMKGIMSKSYNFNSFYISSDKNADIKAEICSLPFSESSVDCVILVNTLDTEENPHAVFREIDRILTDDGKLIIAGFNKVSFLGFYSSLPLKSIFKHKNYISISRLSDWMSLLSYDVKHVFNINKIPPVVNNKVIKYLSFLNNNIFSKINYFGNSYVFIARKKTYKHIAIKNWHKKNNIILGKFSKPAINHNYEK